MAVGDVTAAGGSAVTVAGDVTAAGGDEPLVEGDVTEDRGGCPCCGGHGIACCPGLTLPDRLWMLIENPRDVFSNPACPCLEGLLLPLDFDPPSGWWICTSFPTTCTGQAPNTFTATWKPCRLGGLPPTYTHDFISACPDPGVGIGGGSATPVCSRPLTVSYPGVAVINTTGVNCCSIPRVIADVTVFE